MLFFDKQVPAKKRTFSYIHRRSSSCAPLGFWRMRSEPLPVSSSDAPRFPFFSLFAPHHPSLCVLMFTLGLLPVCPHRERESEVCLPFRPFFFLLKDFRLPDWEVVRHQTRSFSYRRVLCVCVCACVSLYPSRGRPPSYAPAEKTCLPLRLHDSVISPFGKSRTSLRAKKEFTTFESTQ